MSYYLQCFFKKKLKKLHKNQKKDLDQTIAKIIADPYLGNMKKGDLSGIQVYKFKFTNKTYIVN